MTTIYSLYFSHQHTSYKLQSFTCRGGLEVEPLLHKFHDSTSVGSNPARRQKDFRSNSNTTGGALVNNFSDTHLGRAITQSTAITYFHCPKRDLNHRSRVMFLWSKGSTPKPPRLDWFNQVYLKLKIKVKFGLKLALHNLWMFPCEMLWKIFNTANLLFFFFLVSDLRLSQRMDETDEGSL